MRPLEASEATRTIERLLGNAEASLVEQAISAAQATSDSSAAAIAFAQGALLLREGSLAPAASKLREAADLFDATGEKEASELARVEAAVADARRGIRDIAMASRTAMAELSENGSTPRVRVAALIVRGTADRVLGDASSAHRAFLEAKDRAAFPELKTQALNSLGTLYVVTGALGAAKSVLESAAELCHARGDSVGEAIAMGQLGAAAMGLGDLPLARRHLSRQEWLARQVGDSFGRARALVWLAEVALELGAPDDAVDIATRAWEIADRAGLGTFKAYADRVAGRAKRQLGEDGTKLTQRALDVFREQHLPLGEALSVWDMSLATTPIDRPAAQRALTSLASLGLVDRVLEVLLDLREIEAGAASGSPSTEPTLDPRTPDVRLLLMTSALSGRKAETLETQLVHEDPEGLAASVGEKAAAKRNLARLAAFSVDEQGLVALAVVGSCDAVAALTDRSFSGALGGQIGGCCLFVWPTSFDVGAIVCDTLLVLGDDCSGVVDFAPEARVSAPGFGGAFGASIAGLDAGALIRAAFAAQTGPRSLGFGAGFHAGEARSTELHDAFAIAGLAPKAPSS